MVEYDNIKIKRGLCSLNL